MPLPPPPPTKKPAPPPPSVKASPASFAAAPKKSFTVAAWTDTAEGQKIMVYAPSGNGKTTLATMAPNPVFIGLDDGGRKILNPKTGQPINAVMGVETFQDLRDALHTPALFSTGCTVVLDTVTKAEVLGEQYTFDTIRIDGKPPTSIEEYGYGKGYRYLTETMRLLLTDLDVLVRRGVHVVMLAQQGQAVVANLEGTDYLQDGPKLYANKNGTGVRGEYVEWCDHVFRIGHQSISVTKDDKKATKGKVHGSTDRVIYTTNELHFIAKNRMNGKLPPVVTFSEPADDAIWQFVFNGATAVE